MKLVYHLGCNFGDAINPIIFDYFLPNVFDEDEKIIFIGIGSILGLINVNPNQNAIVFSSGYAANAPSTYGSIPTIRPNYKILCVRGPLTARALGLNSKYAITDGAILLAAIPKFSYKPTQKWSTSYIPHVGSIDFFDWAKLCNEIGLNFIDPRLTPEEVINQIKSSKMIITEAMHGAIIADTFRIPWIAVKAYNTINTFKWKDWCLSMNLKYEPVRFNTILNKDVSLIIFKNKIKNIFLALIINNIYHATINRFFIGQVKKKLRQLQKNGNFHLSSPVVFNMRLDELLICINLFRSELTSNTKK
jgi:succinoglycan biosynthesis protein ExoV